MSTRVAILVGGMLREFENAHKSWTFLKHSNRDVFFSTWDSTYEINQPLKTNIKQEVTVDNIKKYIPDAYIRISKDVILDLTTISSIKKIIYHWKVLLAMVRKTGNTYDTAILTRPDFYFRENADLNKFIDSISDDSVYGLTNIDRMEHFPYYYTQDCLFIAKFSVIEKMIDAFELEPNSDDIHVYLSKYFIKNNITVVKIAPDILEYYICRSIHRNTSKLSFEINKQIGINWWHIKNTGEDPTIFLNFLNNE